MDEGYTVKVWMQEHGHTYAAVARKIGYSRAGLYNALNNNKITRELSDLLFEHFWLNISPNTGSGSHFRHKSGNSPGRPIGPAKRPRFSKLDPFKDEIIALIEAGEKQTVIAERFGTSDSNLHGWLKQNGVSREQRIRRRKMQKDC